MVKLWVVLQSFVIQFIGLFYPSQHVSPIKHILYIENNFQWHETFIISIFITIGLEFIEPNMEKAVLKLTHIMKVGVFQFGKHYSVWKINIVLASEEYHHR